MLNEKSFDILNLKILKEFCKNKSIKNCSKLKKSELFDVYNK